MTVGSVSPLSFTGTPLFLTAFKTPDEFLQANRLLVKENSLIKVPFLSCLIF